MLVFLCIAILFLQLIAMPIRIGFNFYLDLFENDGFIKVYLFGICIFKAALRFEHDADKTNNIVVQRGNKEGKIHLNTNTKDKKSIVVMVNNPLVAKMFENVLVEKVSAHFAVGKANDTFFTVTLIQAVRVLFYSSMSALKCRFSMSITESFTPIYNKNILQVDFIGIITISIADIIVSLIGKLLQNISLKRKQEVAVR